MCFCSPKSGWVWQIDWCGDSYYEYFSWSRWSLWSWWSSMSSSFCPSYTEAVPILPPVPSQDLKLAAQTVSMSLTQLLFLSYDALMPYANLQARRFAVAVQRSSEYISQCIYSIHLCLMQSNAASTFVIARQQNTVCQHHCLQCVIHDLRILQMEKFHIRVPELPEETFSLEPKLWNETVPPAVCEATNMMIRDKYANFSRKQSHVEYKLLKMIVV